MTARLPPPTAFWSPWTYVSSYGWREFEVLEYASWKYVCKKRRPAHSARKVFFEALISLVCLNEVRTSCFLICSWMIELTVMEMIASFERIFFELLVVVVLFGVVLRKEALGFHFFMASYPNAR